ncbi:MAG: nitrogenase component 1 [Candidatus Gracilibacteria bacterium]|nr:nitrogenase component 1 [Candidatus Gracilibacteria bacterium]MDD2908597.1 nitrogenase component 1 [Candidatus Gracilibacteria bacterium]
MSDIIEKYSQIYGSPFLTGVMMGVNSIKDAALYVDGPDCVFYKADMIYKTHDINSNLKSPSIDSKLYFSGVMPNKMVRGYDDKIKRKLSFIDENDNFNLGVITCMPVTGLLAIQYDNIYSDFKKDFVFVPSKTDKFRIDGYAALLKEIAKKIYLDKKEKQKKHISIVGFLYDRNEGDCKGNLEEIKRLLSLIGVTIDSIWLDGGEYSNLKKIENSELIVSFSYGEQAAKILSKRLGIDEIFLDIPFGIDSTIKFLEKIGDKLGIDKEFIQNTIKKELNNIKTQTINLDDKIFLDKNYIYAGDPFLEKGIIDIGNFLGMNHIKTYSYTGTKDVSFDRNLEKEKIDLVIGNSDFNYSGLKFEFGFPSYNSHFLTNKSYFGFVGILNFIERLYNEISNPNKI